MSFNIRHVSFKIFSILSWLSVLCVRLGLCRWDGRILKARPGCNMMLCVGEILTLLASKLCSMDFNGSNMVKSSEDLQNSEIKSIINQHKSISG